MTLCITPNAWYFSDSRGPLKKEEWFEGCYLKQTFSVKAKSDVPVAAVGGIRKLEMIDSILSQKTAYLISMSRLFIREPALYP